MAENLMRKTSPPIKVYLYSINTGKLVVNEGFVQPSIYKDRVRFLGKKKSILCPAESGKVFNASVWLPKRDDAKARKLLIDYEENLIFELRNRVQTHLSKIHVLKGVEIHEAKADRNKIRTSLR